MAKESPAEKPTGEESVAASAPPLEVAANDAPASGAPSQQRNDSRHIPRAVARAVWKRDGGSCQWRLPSGKLCGATRFIQVDHILPRARGGPSTLENLRLLCQAHNQHAAREVFGQAWMEQFLPRTG